MPQGKKIYKLSFIKSQIELSTDDKQVAGSPFSDGETFTLGQGKIRYSYSSGESCVTVEFETGEIEVFPIIDQGERALSIPIIKGDEVCDLDILPPDDQRALKVLRLREDKVKICLHKKKGGNIRVLAIDGGGIKGIIPAMILESIEKKVNQAGQTSKKISCMFDLMAGTSTGAILVLGVSLNKTAALAGAYAKLGKDIFPPSKIPWILKCLAGARWFSEAKFSEDKIEAALQKYFVKNESDESAPSVLADAKTHTMVTAYDINNRKPLFFKSWEERYKKVLMWEAVRASTAAPTYFAPAQVAVPDSNLPNPPRIEMVDGGVFANNPAVSAYVEAKRLFPAENITLVSIGTGTINRSISRKQLKDWGIKKWFYSKKGGKTWSPIISSMLDGGNDAVDYQMKRLTESNPRDKYFRMQIGLTKANDDIDDASDKNINNLRQTAECMVNRDPLNMRVLAKIINAMQC